MSSFNALIEGNQNNQWEVMRYKLVALEIPQNVALLEDGVYRYGLKSTTRDFRHFEDINPSFGDEVSSFEILSLSHLNGLVLPYVGGNGFHILERPRSILLEDGRLFSSLCDLTYLRILKGEIGDIAKQTFSNSGLDELYKRIVLRQTV